jgi:GWxTD domain-containing protein
MEVRSSPNTIFESGQTPRRSPVALGLAALLCVGLIPVAPACLLPPGIQQSFTSLTYEQLRDSLAGVNDTSWLRSMLRQQPKSEPFQAGLVALRLGELGADPDFSEALGRFRQAAKRQPARAEAWYGLGRAQAARAKWEMEDPLRLGSRVGLGGLERAASYYARALLCDSSFSPAGVALANVALSLLDTVRLKQARELVRRAIIGPPERNSELLLAWGRLERATGMPDFALSAFTRYLATGENRSVGLLELARTLLAQGQAAGEPPYYEGAALDDPEAVAQYRADLEVIAPDSILSEYDRLRGQSRAAFLHRFWTDRDHFELRPEGERLREHYRRLLYARRHFPLTVSRRFYGRLDAYRSGNTEVDDRGVIYIRQGEPAERLRPFVFGTMPNESWRYLRAEGDLLFHFSSGYDRNGGGDLYDYRLVRSVLDLRGADDAPRDQLILSRQSLSPVYSRMLNWGTFGAANEQARERNIGSASIAVGTTTDSHELRYRRRLAAVADLIAVGQTPRGGLAHLVFGIAAPGATWRRTPTGVEYPVRVRLVALDRHDRAVATLDTSLVVEVGRPLEPQEYVVGRVELPLPPGRWAYRAALEQGDSAGIVLPRDTVLVAHSGEAALSLSDIALGSPGRAVAWRTDVGDTVLLAPSALFREQSQVEIYYEVQGARPGTAYHHEIAVLKPSRIGSDQRQPLVSLGFDEVAVNQVIRSRRVIRLDQLKRESYVVEVRVSGPDGKVQARRRLMRLVRR